MQKGPLALPKISNTYPAMMKFGSYTLPKESPKIYKSRDTPLDFYWVFKDCFNKNGYNFDDVSKIDYSRPS